MARLTEERDSGCEALASRAQPTGAKQIPEAHDAAGVQDHAQRRRCVEAMSA
jgi:hypothetical protein